MSQRNHLDGGCHFGIVKTADSLRGLSRFVADAFQASQHIFAR